MLANRAAASSWGAVWETEQPMEEFPRSASHPPHRCAGTSLPPEVWVTLRAVREGESSLHFQEVIYRPQGDALPVLVNAAPLTFSYWQRVGMAPQLRMTHAGMPSAHDPGDRRRSPWRW